MKWVNLHDEDVVFRFEGNHADQLTPGRFYEGTVDGFADFGVFVDIGDSVTGLLHRSELDQRLESLDWDQGDTVFVQVTGVQDNGNVDLSWSIRQSRREFRAEAIDGPDGDRLLDDEEDEAESEPDPEPESESEPEPESEPEQEPEPEPQTKADHSEADTSTNGGAASVEPQTTTEPIETGPPERVTVDALEDSIGERVRIEGRVIDVRQTGGPTIFEVRDEAGVAECAAFKEAGVRAYPEVEVGDLIRLTGEVERRRGGVQIETESLKPLAEADADAVVTRLDDALESKAHPGEVEPLVAGALVDLDEAIADAAGTIRRAVIESRPIVLRHTATADGYVAGAAIERAVLPLVRDQHDRDDAEYHYFDRQPLEDEDYDMSAATNDVTRMLDNRARHDEKLPLVVLVDTGSTEESRDGIELLDVYDVDRLVIDSDGGFETGDLAEGVVPEGEQVTTTVLAANVACGVGDVREEIAHLPAVSYWEEAPEAYADLARKAGYDADTARELREAVALEAYYQSYEDKRELIADLLFAGDEEVRSLASHVSEQFRAKLDDELDTVRPHVEIREGDVTVAVLDTDAFTHRFDFPPTALLLDALFRDLRTDHDRLVVVGLDEADLQLRSTEALDVRELGERVAERVPEGGVLTAGVRRGRVSFLIGEREGVRESTIDVVTDLLV
ncbi:DHH family phosphoesterase [Halalkalicoccus subterraneus]|uniref:DHH family phosphoesterase n=1 Tax=Halalkalicoccus subterraneus TaxID=2675002 RepID=UPI000EFB667E|nr:OB-fold nucleic acid binding domain-containing protein [Halalkalicoccus subterraneus]